MGREAKCSTFPYRKKVCMEGDNPHLSLKLQVKDACLILLKSSVSSVTS